MNLAETADLIGLFVGFFLTIMVFSYLLGDNGIFRIAIHIFIGVTAAYATMVVVYNIMWYQLLVPLLTSPASQILSVGPPILLGVVLMTRLSNRMAKYSTPILAFIVGVGAAAAVGGAVQGTLFPQVNAAMGSLDFSSVQLGESSVLFWFFNGLVTLVGTVTTLIYFHFGTRARLGQPSGRELVLEISSLIGQGFIAVTLGALFAGVFAAALAAFVDRVYFIWDFLWSLISLFVPIS